MDIEIILNNIYRLTPEAMEIMADIAEEQSLPKGKLLLRANKVEENLYFMKSGIARAFAKNRGKDVTFWFGNEGAALVSMRSYVYQLPGYESIELIEDCEVYSINAARLQELYKEDISLANWGRKFAEQELINTEKRLISLQIGTASERYAELMQESPHLIQRIPLNYIASYLGISAVSLSRIRAELK